VSEKPVKKENRKVDWDAPETTIASKNIIQQKKALRLFYKQCYQFFKNEIGEISDKKIVELGSGAGFIKEYLHNCITSDVLYLPFVDRQIDAMELPFNKEELDYICMIDVFHHIPDVKLFLNEAVRVLQPGGKVLMVEPANTKWGRFIYQNFHHELFDPFIKDWKLPNGGPMSSANGALPWIVFKRDWETITKKKFPMLSIQTFEKKIPLLYLLSGGLSYPQILPTKFISLLDKISASGMFYFICLEKE
jgi:SAM-dependent methyltransferase